MNAKRFNMIMIGVFVVLAGACIGITVYASTWLKERSHSIITTKLDTIALEQKQRVNQKAEAELEKNADTVQMLSKIVPKSKDQASTIAELLKIAEEVNADISSITFPTSELGAVKTTPKTTDASSGTTSTTPTPAPATPSVTQAKPVEGLSGILGIEVSIAQINRKGGGTGSGLTYDQMLNFIKGIERNRRTMQIKNLQILPLQSKTGPGIGGYSLTMTLNIFVKP